MGCKVENFLAPAKPFKEREKNVTIIFSRLWDIFMLSQVHKNIGITVKNYFIIAIKDADTTPVFLLIAFVILFFVLYIVAKIKEYVESKIKKEADKRAEYLVEERKRDIDKEILRYIEQRKNEEKEHKARNLRNIISICDKIKKDADEYVRTQTIKIETKMQHLRDLQEATKKIVEERQIGFPWLAERISEAVKVICQNPYQRRESYKYRQSLKDIEILKGIIAFHEYLYPHLKELHVKIDETQPEENSNYIESERADESHFWLTPEEYRSLPSAERNQLALDRYRKRHLSEWEVGKRYERYIGFTFELKGYKVDYDGISYRKEDRGRDLICEKGDEVLIIQCKNWSHSKTIYEKHIFQFFGTVFYARIEEKKRNPMAPRKVKGLFFTTTKLSDYAIEAANALNIDIILEEIDKNYPCIKCNIRNGEKIYHLPFDQLYDRTKIIPNTGEFYAKTCQEAEARGFRRAMKYF